MAVDTRDKRASVLGFAAIAILLAPDPTGSLAAVAARQQLAHNYPLAVASPSPITPSGNGGGPRPGAKYAPAGAYRLWLRSQNQKQLIEVPEEQFPQGWEEGMERRWQRETTERVVARELPDLDPYRPLILPGPPGPAPDMAVFTTRRAIRPARTPRDVEDENVIIKILMDL